MMVRRCMLGLASFLLLASGNQAFAAFDDLDNTLDKKKIEYLDEYHILTGITETTYAPEHTLNVAQGVSSLVKGLDLNIDNMRFIKKPEASDYYTRISNDAWYSSDMIIAHHNGLDIPADVDVTTAMTRGQFATLLWQAVEQVDPDINESGGNNITSAKANQPIADSTSLSAIDQQMVEQVIHNEIATLDQKGKFYPDEPITRAEAAVMLYNAIELTGKLGSVGTIE
ncbi:S-layer homology domain-containing protein [Paenibacillus nicotianae]|uniref:S-layer homology domain-containing protein n=1 Tax=Paenibacillus nicotianae TaxID=1526551 RepID=A0ABW4UW86_9BACL